MTLLIVLTLIFIGSVIGLVLLDWMSDWDLILMGVALFSGVGVLIMVIVLAVNHWTADASIVRYEIIKTTIEASREEEMSEIERATLTQTIMEVNQNIASNKYWNETSFDIFVPDKLTELEYLK